MWGVRCTQVTPTQPCCSAGCVVCGLGFEFCRMNEDLNGFERACTIPTFTTSTIGIGTTLFGTPQFNPFLPPSPETTHTHFHRQQKMKWQLCSWQMVDSSTEHISKEHITYNSHHEPLFIDSNSMACHRRQLECVHYYSNRQQQPSRFLPTIDASATRKV